MGHGRRHHRHLPRPRHPIHSRPRQAPVPGLRSPLRAHSAGRPDGRYKGTATATWTVTWTAPAFGDGGEFTETRQTAFTAAAGEVQVLN
ncbi:hypothetical protein [Streptomyces sp. NPDC002403]